MVAFLWSEISVFDIKNKLDWNESNPKLYNWTNLEKIAFFGSPKKNWRYANIHFDKREDYAYIRILVSN